MDAVQTPIIPTIGALIRETPGTISLGQGVAHYGPPQAAMDAVSRALGEHSINQYQPVAGLPQLLDRIAAKLLAENRIDFRDLVKQLAGEFQTRIEMRQIGVRDEAKLLADYGDCGQPVCCGTFLSEMPPVSMKMAKVQKATLDPTKISGRCGRLKCCLRYELPNAKGQVHGGCGSEGSCDNPSGCGTGGCGSGGCGSCGH